MRHVISLIVETSADSEELLYLITDTIAPMVVDLIEDENATIDEDDISVQEIGGSDNG